MPGSKTELWFWRNAEVNVSLPTYDARSDEFTAREIGASDGIDLVHMLVVWNPG